MTEQQATNMSVEIDLGACAGHGRCFLEAPEVFGYDEVDNKAYVLEGADIAVHADAVRSAEEACPEAAVILHRGARK